MNAEDPRIIAFIFSYNRGPFLENCIRSMESHWSSVDLCIIDDNSTDPETVRTLDLARRRHTVLSNQGHKEFEAKTGGLYGSMNLAMKYARENGFVYTFFIQDDMQLVRDVTPDDISHVENFFTKITDSIQVSPSFTRILSAADFFNDHCMNEDAKAYVRKDQSRGGKSHFSATGVFHVDRFFRIFESFEAGEAKNSEKAKSLGLKYGKSFYPFMCWLPYPISHRSRSRSPKHRLVEWLGRSGYYPISSMSPPKVRLLLNRDPYVLPLMEKFLNAPEAPRKDVWSTGGGEYNMLAYGGLAAKLFRGAKAAKALLVRKR
jgi:glycosyltransferase involved in cell wall biosynthesis